MGIIEPLRGAMLSAQGVSQPTHRQPEGQNKDSIDKRKQYPGLEIADAVSQALPSFVEGLPHVEYLEERVNERRNRGTLRQDQQNAKDQHYQNHREQPPTLVPPEERQQLARNPKASSCNLQQVHVASPFLFLGNIP